MGVVREAALYLKGVEAQEIYGLTHLCNRICISLAGFAYQQPDQSMRVVFEHVGCLFEGRCSVVRRCFRPLRKAFRGNGHGLGHFDSSSLRDIPDNVTPVGGVA
ncbi:hypothetical protein D3C80_1929430 [compost metagenome]